MPSSGPRPSNPSIARAVADAFRRDPAVIRILEQAKAELAEKKAKPKRQKGKRNR